MTKAIPHYVDYTPDPAMTRDLIVRLNARTKTDTAQQLAKEWASYIAAVCYVLRHTNTSERVKFLVEALADDACRQYEAREAELKKRANGADNG